MASRFSKEPRNTNVASAPFHLPNEISVNMGSVEKEFTHKVHIYLLWVYPKFYEFFTAAYIFTIGKSVLCKRG